MPPLFPELSAGLPWARALADERSAVFARSFGFVPVHLRMPYVASVSFGYVCMLSFTRGDMSDKVEPEAEPTALPVVGRDAAAALHAPLHPRGTAEKT